MPKHIFVRVLFREWKKTSESLESSGFLVFWSREGYVKVGFWSIFHFSSLYLRILHLFLFKTSLLDWFLWNFSNFSLQNFNFELIFVEFPHFSLQNFPFAAPTPNFHQITSAHNSYLTSFTYFHLNIQQKKSISIYFLGLSCPSPKNKIKPRYIFHFNCSH